MQSPELIFIKIFHLSIIVIDFINKMVTKSIINVSIPGVLSCSLDKIIIIGKLLLDIIDLL